MKMKITILEDSVIESERLKNGIRKYGQQYDWDIEIDEYESGEEYFSKNSEGTTIQASAFFLDIQMGQMNGIEVAKRLRESGYQGIIVFLIIPELSEPPVRTLGATIPENESHIFR